MSGIRTVSLPERDLKGSFPEMVYQHPWVWKIEEDAITHQFRIRFLNENCCSTKRVTLAFFSLEAVILEFQASELKFDKCSTCRIPSYIPFNHWEPLSFEPNVAIPLDYPVLSLFSK
jgi:hypothetical protein